MPLKTLLYSSQHELRPDAAHETTIRMIAFFSAEKASRCPLAFAKDVTTKKPDVWSSLCLSYLK
jgi:hypothetical protein